MIITPETLEGKNLDSPSKVQSPIVNALRNAHEWKFMLETSINGEEPNGLSLDKLVSGFPADWDEQKKIFNIKSA